ncbi:MAG: hypothetical protein SV775_18600 [Thermodesulfobacteriota bacterium]|nr:hypothetical protein [Thermodesulfobacteriota bacterium]
MKELEEWEKQQADFQNLLFHELITSLYIIGGYSSRIAGKHTLTPEIYQHYGGAIKECSASLSFLSEKMLLLARLESGENPLSMEDVCIKDTTEQIISFLSHQAQEQELSIHFRSVGDIQL